MTLAIILIGIYNRVILRNHFRHKNNKNYKIRKKFYAKIIKINKQKYNKKITLNIKKLKKLNKMKINQMKMK